MLKLFEKLAEIPGGSGFEEKVVEAIVSELKRILPDVSVDPIGNVTGILGKGKKSVMICGIRHVRVRHHQDIARIEVQPEDFPTILANCQAICQSLEGLGYTYITMDLAGFQSGSLNKTLASHGR